MGDQGARSSRESCAPASATTAILSLVAGTAVGTLAMYLLDPEHGEDRRAAARRAAQRALEASGGAAHQAYDSTKHFLGDAWETVSDKAADLSSAASDAMPSGKDVRKSGRRFMNGASDVGSNISDKAQSWFQAARDAMPERHLGLERHSDYAMNPPAVTATALGTLALGAGAMWLFDANRGRARRAWLGQKANRLMNEIGKFGRATGRHLSNKAKGYYHETASAVSNVTGAASANTSGSGCCEDVVQQEGV